MFNELYYANFVFTIRVVPFEPQPVKANKAAAVSARAIPFFKFMGISFLSAMTIILLL